MTGAPLSRKLRLSYGATIPFSLKTTVILCLAWFASLCGLVAFNFYTQAKQKVCVAVSSSEYDPDTCQPAPLTFYQTLYTKPVHQADDRTIGTFPWQIQGLGNDGTNGPIDYSIVSKNWTADALKCAMVDQTLVLHLDSDSSTTSTCYYCGPDLRMLCMDVDSERTSIPAQSAVDYQTLLNQYDILLAKLHAAATTAVNSGTVGSLQMKRHAVLDGLAPGVLPWNDSGLSVALGTSYGYVPIYSNSSNSAAASIASSASVLSDFIESVTSRDLQPDQGDDTSPPRTLLVNYICSACTKQYKPWHEIFAVVLGSTTAVLSVLYTVYRTLAEWAVRGDDASSPPSGTYPTALASTTLPAIYQKPSYNGSFQWQQPVGYNPVQMA